VKADTQRIDVSQTFTALLPALATTESPLNLPHSSAAELLLCRADLSSTQLSVWHCALII
jgi:hypothetical protein